VIDRLKLDIEPYNQSLKTYRPNKSDISYLKISRLFNVPIHSRALLAAILCWLVTL